jgi:hypothetical protein
MRTQVEIDRDNETARTLEFLAWEQEGHPRHVGGDMWTGDDAVVNMFTDECAPKE